MDTFLCNLEHSNDLAYSEEKKKSKVSMWTVKNENTREGNQKVLWPRLVTSAIQFHLKMRLSKLASVPDWSLWGKWDNSDYSNEKYRTNMITTCGIHVFLKVSQLVGVYMKLKTLCIAQQISKILVGWKKSSTFC